MAELSDSDSETSEHSPPVFVPEGGYGAANPNDNHESIISIHAQELAKGATAIILVVDLDDAPVATDSASFADSHISDEPNLEHLCQNKLI